MSLNNYATNYVEKGLINHHILLCGTSVFELETNEMNLTYSMSLSSQIQLNSTESVEPDPSFTSEHCRS